MHPEAFQHFQNKHREFLEQEEERTLLWIRRAKVDDLDSILSLLQILWPQYALDQKRQRTQIENDLRSGSKAWWVAINQGAAVGLITARIMDVLWHDSPILHIEELVVIESWRRKGVAKQLLDTTIQFGKEQHSNKVELDSGFARTESHQFYEKMGFEFVSKLFSKTI